MQRTTTVVFVLGTLLAPATIGAQAPGLDPSARLGEFRMQWEMLLEGRGSWLGATVRALPALAPGQAMARGVRFGVEVEHVRPETAAARAGLQAGDVVIEFDRVTVTDTRQFERLVRHTPPGRLAMVVVVRKGERRTLPVTL